MIRMALIAGGFVAVTLILVLFQPGGARGSKEIAIPTQEVTRAEPAIADIPSAPVDVVAPTPAPRVVMAQPSLPTADLGDEDMRRMTWTTLSNLNQATGQAKAPGEPGSLLHTIVQRSLGDGAHVPVREQTVTAAAPVAAPKDLAQVYLVRPGDSLMSIAEEIYGDLNMTGRLFTANQAILARPDDLRPGQTLVLPAR